MHKILNKIFLLIALIHLSIIGVSQEFSWAKKFDGEDAKSILAMALDTAANVFTTGEYRGIVDFDPGLGVEDTFYIENEAVWSCFVNKLNTEGEFQWAVEMDQYGSDRSQGWDIATDTEGNVITTGRFEGATDFDPDIEEEFLLNSISENIFVWKLSADGELVWAKLLGGPFGDDLSRSVATDSDQNVLTTGYFQSSGDFDPGIDEVIFTASGRDIFISKLDSDGNYVWAKQIGGTGNQEAYSIATDDLGNVYVCGLFNGTVDFDPGAGVYNMTDLGGGATFILKLDSDGNFVWAKQFESINQNYGTSIDVDSEYNVLIGGVFDVSADFDPGPGEYELMVDVGFDMYIAKLDVSGNFVYAKGIGGDNSDVCRDIFVDQYDAVYYGGQFRNTVDFDPGPGTHYLTAEAYDDIVISKLNEDGDFEWAKRTGGASTDWCLGIAVDGLGAVYSSGIFGETVDFDPGDGVFEMTGDGTSNAWIQKLDVVVNCDEIMESLSLSSTVCQGGFIVGEFASFSEYAEATWDISDVDSFTGSVLIWDADTVGTFTLSVNLSSDDCSRDTSFVLNVYPTYILSLDTTVICAGDSVSIFDEYVFEEGMYSQMYESVNGCDSTLQKWVMVNPIYNDTLSFIEICAQDSALIFDSYAFVEGFYYDSLTSVSGCDSIWVQELVIHDLPEVNFNELEDEIVCLGSGIITLAGTPTDGIFSGSGVSGGEFDPESAGVGTHTLYYSYEDVNSCMATDSVQINVVDCLGLPEQNQNDVTVYPNPFSNYTTINFGSELTESHAIVIYDALGQTVYRNENVVGSSLEIKKEQLGVGVYFLSLFDPNLEEIFSAKLIVE